MYSKLLSRKCPESPPCAETGSPARSAVAGSAGRIFAGTGVAPPASLTGTKRRGPKPGWGSSPRRGRPIYRTISAPTAATTTGPSPGRSSRGPGGGF